MPSLSVQISGGLYMDNVQLLTYSRGRRNKTEPYSSDTYTIEVRNPSQLSTIGLEQKLRFSTTDSYFGTIYLGTGYVTNIQYNYGQVAAMDSATVSAEGYLSYFGRGQLNNFALTGGLTGDEAKRVGTAITGNAKTVSTSGCMSYTDASTTYTGNAQNVISQLLVTEQGRIEESTDSFYFWGRDYLFPRPNVVNEWHDWLLFTDTNAATTGIAYDQIIFSNLADNYFTQTTVQPSAVATQTSGTGSRNLVVSTYDVSTSQASDLAKYMLGEFDSNSSVPVTIRSRSSLTSKMNPAWLASLLIGWKVKVNFRGSTYYAVVEGVDVTFAPDEAVYYFHLSGYEQNNYFLLNDDVYGRLDFNQLSF